MIEIKKISKSYKNNTVLKDISFNIETGKFTVLIGESGCGKTTLLKMINKLIVPTKGDIFIDGKDIKYLGNMTEEEYLKTIQAKLQWFVPKPVKRVEIPKAGDPTKTRPLGIPCIVDRIVQQCFKQVLEPIVEAKFYKYSFGFRPLRSAENAYAACCHTVNFAVMHFVVDVDIKDFFDNVNHDKLMK